MIRNTLLVIFACLNAGLAQAASEDAVTLTKSHKLVLSKYPNSPIDLKPFIDGTSTYEVKIISQKTYKTYATNYTYLLLAVAGFTTSGNGNGECGAGSETNLLWLQIPGNYIGGSQSFLASSCATGIDGVIPDKGSFSESYYAPREDREYTVTYDENRPMDGLQITSKEKTL